METDIVHNQHYITLTKRSRNIDLWPVVCLPCRQVFFLRHSVSVSSDEVKMFQRTSGFCKTQL